VKQAKKAKSQSTHESAKNRFDAGAALELLFDDLISVF